jgi:uncharacterized phage protein (TIGR02220 family)
MNKKPKPNYFVVTPYPVLVDEQLSPSTKLLYGIVSSLTRKEGYCFATNEYISDSLGVSKRTVERGLKQLEEGEYIVRETSCVNNKSERKIWLTSTPKGVEQYRQPCGTTKMSGGGDKNGGHIYINNNDISKDISNNKTHVAKPSASAFSYEEFLELFNQTVGTQHRGDNKSKGSFKARVKEGYTRDDFKLAITNAKNDRYLMGENDSNRRYLIPEYITRSEKLDLWINSKKKGTGPGGLKWN